MLTVLAKYWWNGKRCSRCHKVFKRGSDVKVGYGWYIFCAKCKDSFEEWLGEKKGND